MTAWSRQIRRSLTALAVVTVGWSQPIPPADAAFTTAANASSAMTAHTLDTPVLSCSAGGLLSTTVTLTWPQVSSASTPDPYASPPNSSYRADGYEIYRATGNGGLTLLASPGRTATSYSDDPGGTLTTYRYRMRTKKAGWTGSFSNEATARVTSLPLVGVSASCSA